MLRLQRVVTAFVLIATLSCRKGKKDEQYRAEKVDRGNIVMTVTATGTLSAVTTVLIGSQVQPDGSRGLVRLRAPRRRYRDRAHPPCIFDRARALGVERET